MYKFSLQVWNLAPPKDGQMLATYTVKLCRPCAKYCIFPLRSKDKVYLFKNALLLTSIYYVWWIKRFYESTCWQFKWKTLIYFLQILTITNNEERLEMHRQPVLKNQLPEGFQPPVIENIDLFRALCYFAVSSVHLNKLSCNELGMEWPDNWNVKYWKG